MTTEEEGTKKGKKKSDEAVTEEGEKEGSGESDKAQQEEVTEGDNGNEQQERDVESDDSMGSKQEDVDTVVESVSATQQQDKLTDELEVSLVNQFGHSPHCQRTGAMSRRTTPPVAWYQLHGLEDEVWRSCAVVTETIVYVLWQVVRSQEDRKAWKLFGTVFASLDDFSSCHCLIAPVRVIKQRLVMCLACVIV